MSLSPALASLFTDFLALFYPRLCAGCQTALVRGEKVICLGCLLDLPKTGFEKVADNPVAQLFWGRAEIRFATALCSFDKGGIMQQLMYQLKYKGSRETGEILGKVLGNELKQSDVFPAIDFVVPVPLHPRRERERGYNQSTVIGRGLAKILEKPLVTGNLVRIHYSETQTRKGKYERWENVKELFGVRYPGTFEGKHLLLVDDVITTGATLEACAKVLLQIPGAKVSIATLAYA